MNIAATRQATAVSIFDSVTGDVTLADCAPSESLLLVGLRAGLDLPYECASGGCGSCRAQLLDGVVATRWPDATGLTERDRRRGNRILLCQSLPDTDCQVRVALPAGRSEHAGDALPPAPARSHATLSRRVMLTGDTARLGSS
jgi:ferredoxin